MKHTLATLALMAGVAVAEEVELSWDAPTTMIIVAESFTNNDHTVTNTTTKEVPISQEVLDGLTYKLLYGPSNGDQDTIIDGMTNKSVKVDVPYNQWLTAYVRAAYMSSESGNSEPLEFRVRVKSVKGGGKVMVK